MKQVRQMIQLNEDYALSADSMNILLHQRMLVYCTIMLLK